jgi:hypothetical protein
VTDDLFQRRNLAIHIWFDDEPPPESALQRLIRWHFWVLVWLTIAGSLVQLAGFAADPVAVWYRFAPYTGRIVLGPLIIGAGQLFLWIAVYRYGGRTARGAAGLVGGFLALLVLVQLLRATIQVPISVPGTLFYAYAATAHLIYAVGGSRLGHGGGR